MNKFVAGAIAAAAIATLAGAARAGNVCQWTGKDWACGDGNVVSQHYSEAVGPQTVITAVPTVMPTGQPAHQYNQPRPY